MAHIEQGEDKKLVFTLTDCNDTPTIYADLEDVIIVIRIDHTPYHWFSKEGRPGYGEILATDVTNECAIILTSEQTKKLPLGTIFVELTLFHPDSDFADGYRKETTIAEFGQLKFSQYPNVPSLPLRHL